MSKRPAIIVVTHSRPAATDRLLRSLSRADIGDGVDLVVSIDHHRGEKAAAGQRLGDMADEFSWPHGSRRRIDHDNIGLVEHFHRCGDLTAEYGAVVLLEDDLLVGPGFLRWAEAILAVGRADDAIAGASLAAPWFDGFRHHRFEPIHDGCDVVYAQVPWYDGVIFSDTQWHAYRTAEPRQDISIHASFGELGDDEWFPGLVRHLVATNRYWALPRMAQATGTGAIGAHFDERTDWFQSELAAGFPSDPRLPGLTSSGSVYDDHMEPTAATVQRLAPELSADIVVDLLGTRDLSRFDANTPVLTTRPVRRALKSWGAAMHPLVMNVAYDEPGDAIHLAEVRDVEVDDDADRHTRAVLQNHHRRGRRPGRRALTADLSVEVTAGIARFTEAAGAVGRNLRDRRAR